MGSRIREQPDRLFTLFTEVVAPENGADGWILQKFPDEFAQEDVLKTIPMFCFPTATMSPGPVQHFCFVLTDVDSMFTFGFCRLTTDGKTCICILSYLPWHDMFYKLLNYIVDLMTKHPSDDLIGFLKTAYRTEIPGGGEELHIIHKLQRVEFQAFCPDSKRLPTIPENRATTEYFNALDVNNMITIFASLLNERRIIITSKKLGRLTACVMACNILLYPMRWQHIFVPVLPKKLLEYVTAPMPFIIGVPGELMPTVLNMDIGEVVIVDADQNTVQTPFNDAQILPSSVVQSIRSGAGNMFGDGVARSFMRALVELIGGYRFGLCLPPGEKISFDMDKFIRNRPANLQVILSKLTDQQIFRMFIDERLDLLNKGIGFSDEFENEVSLLIDHESGNPESSIADQYRRWSSKGGDLFRSVTSKMKDRSRGAVKGIRSKMQDRSSRTSELAVADRFGGSEPVLSWPIPASPPQSRVYAVNPPSGNLDYNAAISRNNFDRDFDSRSLESEFLQNPGLTVDLPIPKPRKKTPVPPVVPVVPQPVVLPQDDALISFEDDAATAADDLFLGTAAVRAHDPSQANLQNFIDALYAPNNTLTTTPVLNGRVSHSPHILPATTSFVSQPVLSATQSAPIWDTRPKPVTLRHPLGLGGQQQAAWPNQAWRPAVPASRPLPVSAPMMQRNGPVSSLTDAPLRNTVPDKGWENFG